MPVIVPIFELAECWQKELVIQIGLNCVLVMKVGVRGNGDRA